MPLPSVSKYGAKQCQVKSKRTGLPCKNPAAYGTNACRYHGAHRANTAMLGQQHPNYQHGNATKEARYIYSAASKNLRQLEAMGFKVGMFSGSKISGRKPKVS
jgi:hypothetical protein